MKKLFIALMFGFLFSGNAYAFNQLKGINEVDLLVESLNEYAEKCSITEEKIETNAKYVLQNSKIKISERALIPYLYIQVIVINDGNICSVYSRITVETLTDAPFNSGNRGSFIYYKNDRISSGGINSNIGKFVMDNIEEMMKELVVKHHEDNQ